LIECAVEYTFFAGNGKPIENSTAETDGIQVAKDVIQRADEIGRKIVLRAGPIATSDANMKTNIMVSAFDAELNIPHSKIRRDVKPRIVELFGNEMNTTSIVLWDNPMEI
jgi:phosphoglycerate kinase